MAGISITHGSALDGAGGAWLGGSEMARLVRAFDWSRTPVGPVESRSTSLRGAVSMCLHSGFPMAVYWGPDLICLYNDGEREVIGELHPRALGMPARILLRDS